MVSQKFLRVDIDFDPPPEDFRVHGFVERQYDAADFEPLCRKEFAVYRVVLRGIPGRQIIPGDLLFVDLNRKQPGFGQPAVYSDGTLQIFDMTGEVQGAVVGLFRRVATQV